MSDAVRKKISDYLASHPYLRLATVSDAGTPVAHTVGFVSEDATAYFVTDKNSRKFRNLSARPDVAYAVDENYTGWRTIQGVQMEGTAAPVTDPKDMERLAGLMAAKFPEFADLPHNPDFVFVRIEPKTGYMLDNTIAFGHRDRIDF